MKTRLILLPIIAILGACSPTTVEPVNIPKAPQVVESVKPDLIKTQTGIDNSIVANTKTQEQLKTQNKELLEQKINISDALAQAEKIKEKVLAQQAITELEATTHILELKKIESRNLFLEKENKASQEGLSMQLMLLETTRADARTALAKLDTKENEAKELRVQNEYLVEVVGKVNKTNEKLQKENIDLTKKSATAGVYKNWVIALAIGSVLFFFGGMILKRYLP